MRSFITEAAVLIIRRGANGVMPHTVGACSTTWATALEANLTKGTLAYGVISAHIVKAGTSRIGSTARDARVGLTDVACSTLRILGACTRPGTHCPTHWVGARAVTGTDTTFGTIIARAPKAVAVVCVTNSIKARAVGINAVTAKVRSGRRCSCGGGGSDSCCGGQSP